MLDYPTLEARVEDLRLRLAETPADALVALRIGNEPAFLVAFLACARARRPVVLVDPLWKAAEIQRAESLLDISLWIQSGEGLEHSGPVWTLSVDGRVSEPLERVSSGSDTVLESTAVVHWSSGSMGPPKPLLFSPHQLAERAACLAANAPFDPGERVLCSLPLSHCHAIEYLALPTLAIGGELVLMDPLRAAAADVVQTIRECRVTFFSALPRFYEEVLELDVDPTSMRTIRMPMCGSAALDPNVARQFHERFGVPIGQAYGLTEIGMVSLNRHRDPPIRYASVGTVLTGIDWRIHEPNRDGAGELWLRSPGCVGQGDDGWLRTHDRVRADADGYLYVLGRNSRFINVNGAKADPREIERAIETLPWVAECAVKGWSDRQGVERIVAYVCSGAGASVERPAEEVQRHVVESLSILKLPTRVVVLTQLPRTSLGKVAYAELPRPAEEEAPEQASYRPPRDDTERIVAGIWCEVLQRERVGVRDRFTELGGGSLQLVQLTARLEERFGRRLSLVDLFRYPTVEAQAGLLAETRQPSGLETVSERGERQRRALRRRADR